MTLMASSFALLTYVCASFQGVTAYDGQWWRSIAREQRRGFLAGYIDCDVYAARHARLSGIAWNVIEPTITDYYESHPSDRRTHVAAVLVKLARPPPETDRDGEAYTESHGFFDGEYWRQSPPLHRLGFIEGFLECQRKEGNPAGKFPRPPEWYVARVSEWYRITPDDDIDPQRAPEKIADVLLRVRR